MSTPTRYYCIYFRDLTRPLYDEPFISSYENALAAGDVAPTWMFVDQILWCCESIKPFPYSIEDFTFPG